MLPPPLPENESTRLQALYQLNILDTQSEERFNRITRLARRLFGVPMVFISLIDSTRQWFKSSLGIEITETPREISFCGHAILTNDIMIVEDASKDIRFHDNPLVTGNPNIKFYLGCPLTINNSHTVGTLCLMDKLTHKFSADDLQVMRDLANMVQAELQSMHFSTTDELTKLSNRRGFLLIADHTFHICQRENKPLSLLYFDLDKFKYINDNFGHAEGDEVLKYFAKFLLNYFRSSDVIGRIGGDEFCVLCSGLKKDDIEQLVKKFDKALDVHQNRVYHIEYSVGCVQYDKDKHQSVDDLLAESDAIMYENKRNNQSTT